MKAPYKISYGITKSFFVNGNDKIDNIVKIDAIAVSIIATVETRG